MGCVILFIVAFAIGLYLDIDNYSDGNYVMGFLFIAFIMSLIIGVNAPTIEVNTYEVKEYDIQGLVDKDSLHGQVQNSFLLGCGDIESGISYYFFRNDKYGKQLQKIEATASSVVYLREDEKEKPCLKTIYKEIEYRKGFATFMFGRMRRTETCGNVIIVPKNTVKIKYNVDI